MVLVTCHLCLKEKTVDISKLYLILAGLFPNLTHTPTYSHRPFCTELHGLKSKGTPTEPKRSISTTWVCTKTFLSYFYFSVLFQEQSQSLTCVLYSQKPHLEACIYPGRAVSQTLVANMVPFTLWGSVWPTHRGQLLSPSSWASEDGAAPHRQPGDKRLALHRWQSWFSSSFSGSAGAQQGNVRTLLKH